MLGDWPKTSGKANPRQGPNAMRLGQRTATADTMTPKRVLTFDGG